MPPRSPRTGVLLALVCLVLLGLLPILASARPAGADALVFALCMTLWQLACALPLLLLEARRRRGGPRLRLTRRGAAIALLAGALFGLSTYMYIVAAVKAGPVEMAIALQAYPLFAILIEWAFQGKGKTPAELACTLLLLAALLYLTTGGSFRLAEVSWWSLFALAIPLIWAIAHILVKRLLDTTPVTPSQVTASRLALSALFLLLALLLLGEPAALAAALADGATQRAAFLMGLAYYLELLVWFYAVRHIEVSTASSVTVPAPAVTLLLAVLFLGAPVEGYQVAAMAAIAVALYGLMLAGRRGARRRAATT